MSNKKFIIGSVLLFIGYKKYQRFVDFINSLKLGLTIRDFAGKKAIVNISTLNYFGIPYKIKSINLLLGKVAWLATNKNKESNKMIVKNSQIPINFDVLLGNTTSAEIQQSEIEITYLFFGHSIKRLYTPKIEYSTQAKAQKINQKTNQQFEYETSHKECGCDN